MSTTAFCALCQKERLDEHGRFDHSVGVRRAVNVIGGVPVCDHHLDGALTDRNRMARVEHDIQELGQRVTEHIEGGMSKADVVDLVRRAFNAVVVDPEAANA